jgi:hypothetical protein
VSEVSVSEVSGPGLMPPKSRLDRVLGEIPRGLSSKPHIIWLLALGVYLIILPVFRIYTPSASMMLIGGNYTNVTSDIGACIAAGGTLTLLAHSRKRNRIAEASHKILADLYRYHTGEHHPECHVTAADTGDGT